MRSWRTSLVVTFSEFVYYGWQCYSIAVAVLAIALDENIANFYMEHILTKGVPDISLYHRSNMYGSSYGMLTINSTWSPFFSSFFQSNDDQRDRMATLALKDHRVGI